MNGTEKWPLLMVVSSMQKSIFVIQCNLPPRTQATATGYSSKCAADWISAGNESNLSGKDVKSREPHKPPKPIDGPTPVKDSRATNFSLSSWQKKEMLLQKYKYININIQTRIHL